jgi:hypothetical protein
MYHEFKRCYACAMRKFVEENERSKILAEPILGYDFYLVFVPLPMKPRR